MTFLSSRNIISIYKVILDNGEIIIDYFTIFCWRKFDQDRISIDRLPIIAVLIGYGEQSSNHIFGAPALFFCNAKKLPETSAFQNRDATSLDKWTSDYQGKSLCI